MFYLLTLFAQEKAPEPSGGSIFNNPLIPFLAIFVLFMVFMVILPERKRRREQATLMSALKKNDKVYVAGGIVGVIANFHDNEEVTIRLEEGKMRVLKSSIIKVVPDTQSPGPTQSEAIKKA